MSDTPLVLAELQEFAEVIGVPATLRLVDIAGGQDGCYIPITPRDTHPWAEVLGSDAWVALCRAYGGKRLSVPRNAAAASAKARMVALKREGLSHRAIARKLRCTERWVRMVLSDGADDARQGSLAL